MDQNTDSAQPSQAEGSQKDSIFSPKRFDEWWKEWGSVGDNAEEIKTYARAAWVAAIKPIAIQAPPPPAEGAATPGALEALDKIEAALNAGEARSIKAQKATYSDAFSALFRLRYMAWPRPSGTPSSPAPACDCKRDVEDSPLCPKHTYLAKYSAKTLAYLYVDLEQSMAERAAPTQAQAELDAIRSILAHVAEFGRPMDPECDLPPLAQQVFDAIAEAHLNPRPSEGPVPDFDYPAAARSIGLNLSRWFDDTKPYPTAIADAARAAMAHIEALEAGAQAIPQETAPAMRCRKCGWRGRASKTIDGGDGYMECPTCRGTDMEEDEEAGAQAVDLEAAISAYRDAVIQAPSGAEGAALLEKAREGIRRARLRGQGNPQGKGSKDAA